MELVRNALKRSLDDLRDRRLFDFDAGEVQTLRVSWPSVEVVTEVALARDQSSQWQMGAPATGRADQQTLRELLSDLSFLRAKGFVDERQDLAGAALAEAAITFHWTLEGDHIERRARIGGIFEDGRLVKLGAGDSVMIPGGERHQETRTSESMRLLEVSLPAEMGTVPCDSPAGAAN